MLDLNDLPIPVEVVEAVAKDILTAQTVEEQSEKSKGRAPRPALVSCVVFGT